MDSESNRSSCTRDSVTPRIQQILHGTSLSCRESDAIFTCSHCLRDSTATRLDSLEVTAVQKHTGNNMKTSGTAQATRPQHTCERLRRFSHKTHPLREGQRCLPCQLWPQAMELQWNAPDAVEAFRRSQVLHVLTDMEHDNMPNAELRTVLNPHDGALLQMSFELRASKRMCA